MSRHDNFTSFRRPSEPRPLPRRSPPPVGVEAPHPAGRHPGSTPSHDPVTKVELPYVGSRGLTDGAAPREDPPRVPTPAPRTRPQPRRRNTRVNLREAAAWLLAGCLAVGFGITSLRPTPVDPPPSPASAPRDLDPARRIPRPMQPPRAQDVPPQVAAPQVVESLLGDLAGDWTFERILGEATLRVQVPLGDMGVALERATTALRTPEGRQSWDSLGADRLELQSGDLALHLSVTTLDGPW